MRTLEEQLEAFQQLRRPKVHRESKYTRGPKRKEVSAFLATFSKMGSEQILKALSEKERDSKWFAEQFSELYKHGSKREKLRLLQMCMKLVEQNEGQKLTVGDAGSEALELEISLREVKAEILGELSGLDAAEARKALGAGGGDGGRTGAPQAGDVGALPAPAEGT